MRLVIATVLLAIATPANADLVFKFKNPAFSGQGYSAHVLAIEQLQAQRKEEIEKEAERIADELEREEENSVLNKFIRNLESRIYATLSKQLVDSMFADCGTGTDVECANSGSTDLEGATIEWSKDDTTGSITLTITAEDGSTTEITIPGPGEFNF